MIKINVEKSTLDSIETKYYNEIKEEFFEILKTIRKNKKSKNFEKLQNYLFLTNGKVNEVRLKKLIIGKPQDLEDIISDIGEIKVTSPDRFLKFYKNLSQRKIVRTILKELNNNICPYCNRMYTITLEGGGVRPQLDHYYPKTIYPYLSVSFYNLIPSCSICNQSKSTLNTYEKPLFHPYKEEFGNQVMFQINPTQSDYRYMIGASEEFEIQINCLNPKLNTQVNNVDQYLRITKLYNEHKDRIIELLQIMVIYERNQLEEYNENFPCLFNDLNIDKEIYNHIIPNLRNGSLGKQPLDKLLSDIYNQFKC